MRLIDTHCHVHFHAYKNDMDEVVKRSLIKNVFLITVGTQSETNKKAIELAEKYDGVWATIGLHPNHTCEQQFVDEEELDGEIIKTRCEDIDVASYRELAKHPKVVAIGECGLDYYRIPEHLDKKEVKKKQEEVVRTQFDLATELDLPVVIHCRDAHEDQQKMIREYLEAGKLERRGVVHCFTGTLEEAKKYIDLGFLLSFTGIITFPPKKKQDIGTLHTMSLPEIIAHIPLEHIMIETDAPYLTPVPHRGERNEPIYVEYVAQKIAEIKNTSLEEVAETTFQNAVRLFRLKIS